MLPKRRNAPRPSSTQPPTPTPRKRRRAGKPARFDNSPESQQQTQSASPITTPTPSKRRRRNEDNSNIETPSATPQNLTEVHVADHVHCIDDDPDHSLDADNLGPKIDSDEEDVGSGRTYFEAHKGAVTTSNFTLTSLSVPSSEELSTALSDFHQNHPLQSYFDLKAQDFGNHHARMEYILDAGQSLLFYGFGSKRFLLNELATYLSSSTDVIVMHGFNPTISLRNVLTQITSDFLGLKSFSKRSLLDYVDAIREELASKQRIHSTSIKATPSRRRSSSRRASIPSSSSSKDGGLSNELDSSSNSVEPPPAPLLSIIVHNIDGPALRVPETQLALSRLASIPNIRFIASIDHVNAPLLWDAPTYTSFSWFWFPINSFTPYDAETFFSSRPLFRGGAERRVEGAVAMLSSLTDRARNVFRELVVRQIHGGTDEGGNDAGKTGSASVNKTEFNEFFTAVKEQFIVSDAETLRAILTELKTHDLLQQQRRREDAAEVIWIPLPDSQLEDILSEIGLEA